MAPLDQLLTPYELIASELAICRGGYDFTARMEVEGDIDEYQASLMPNTSIAPLVSQVFT